MKKHLKISTLPRVGRAVFRLLRVGLHLYWGIILILSIYPFISRIRRLALKQRWSQQALRIFGIHLNIQGQLMAHMRVSNHISWLDILIVNTVVPSAFVAKDDVRGWPLIGWIATHTETYFIQRGSRRAAHKAALHVADLLRADIDVVAFPEGTTSSGDQVLPFYSALLQGAIKAKVPVQPMAIRYHDKLGQLSAIPEYCDETGLGTSMWRVACADGLAATIYLLPAINTTAYERRSLATALHERITLCLQNPLSSHTDPIKDSTAHAP